MIAAAVSPMRGSPAVLERDDLDERMRSLSGFAYGDAVVRVRESFPMARLALARLTH
jgi:hypothetical protein